MFIKRGDVSIMSIIETDEVDNNKVTDALKKAKEDLNKNTSDKKDNVKLES